MDPIENLSQYSPVACCFLYKAKYLSAPPRNSMSMRGYIINYTFHKNYWQIQSMWTRVCALSMDQCSEDPDIIQSLAPIHVQYKWMYKKTYLSEENSGKLWQQRVPQHKPKKLWASPFHPETPLKVGYVLYREVRAAIITMPHCLNPTHSSVDYICATSKVWCRHSQAEIRGVVCIPYWKRNQNGLIKCFPDFFYK